MDKGEIFKKVQEYLADIPLILVGTGGTIPYGIPGMTALSNRLTTKLDSKCIESSC